MQPSPDLHAPPPCAPPPRGPAPLVTQALGILFLLLSVAGTARAQGDLRENVRTYLRGQPGVRCDVLLSQMQPPPDLRETGGAPLTERPYSEPWYWPTWCLVRITPGCGTDAAVEGNLVTQAVKQLQGRKVQSARWICSLLGGLRLLEANKPQAAAVLLDSAVKEARFEGIGTGDPLLRGLLSCQAAAEFRVKEDNLNIAANRPGIVVTPINAGQLFVTGFTEKRGREDLSAAFTWILLETMRRALESHPNALDLRPMDVEEDLALRLSDATTEVVDRSSEYSQPILRRYLTLGAPVTVLGLANADRNKAWLLVHSLDKNPGWSERSEYKLEAARDGRSEYQPFQNVTSLAQDCALRILTQAWRSRNQAGDPPWPIPAPDKAPVERPEWRVLPPGQSNFKLFVDAVGFEVRGNYSMATKRYGELIRANPRAAQAELDFARHQEAFCRELNDFDTEDRFFMANEGMLRERILALAR